MESVVGRSRRIACIACRQNKSRCEKGEGPCTRCKRHGLTCREDPGFQRMSRSRKIEELEKQVKECTTVISQSRHGIVNGSVPHGHSNIFPEGFIEVPPDALVEPLPDFTLSSDNYEPHNPLPPMRAEFRDLSTPWIQFPSPGNCASANSEHQLVRPLASTSRRLGKLEINKCQIDALFRSFFDYYHPFLSFLDSSLSPDSCFSISPLLFWSIVAVASRRYEDVTLSRLLTTSVTKFTWDTISRLPNSISTVQALLILCTWPFPAASLWLDSTPIWTGIAVSIAQQLGLHRPEKAAEFTRVKPASRAALVDERLTTWAACYIVSQNTAASCGNLSTASFGLNLPVFRGGEIIKRLSSELQHHLLIQRFCSKVGKVMFDTPSILEVQPLSDLDHLITPLEAELRSLEDRLIRTTSNINQLYLLAARLFLQVHYFFVLGPSDSKRHGILKAYTTAERFISTLSSADSTFGLYSYIPNYLFRMLFTAACIVWKVRSSSYHSAIDLEAANALFSKAVSALHKCSVENNDNAGRQAEILIQLWNGQDEMLAENNRTRDPMLKYNSRCSASLAYDCLFYWRDHIGGQAMNGLNSSATIPVDGVRGATSSPSNVTEVAFDHERMNDLQMMGQAYPHDWALNLEAPLF